MNESRLRARYDAGESTALLAMEVGLSRVQLWRRIGRPARYLQHMPSPPDPVFVAWAAGFFDGEGHVHIDAAGCLSIGATQTTPEPLEALHAAFGGSVIDKPAPNVLHRHQWQWSLNGQMAVQFLRLVRPRLKVKGGVADLAIASQARPSRRGRRLTPEERELRTAAHMAMKALNARGRA